MVHLARKRNRKEVRIVLLELPFPECFGFPTTRPSPISPDLTLHQRLETGLAREKSPLGTCPVPLAGMKVPCQIVTVPDITQICVPSSPSFPMQLNDDAKACSGMRRACAKVGRPLFSSPLRPARGSWQSASLPTLSALITFLDSGRRAWLLLLPEGEGARQAVRPVPGGSLHHLTGWRHMRLRKGEEGERAFQTGMQSYPSWHVCVLKKKQKTPKYFWGFLVGI